MSNCTIIELLGCWGSKEDVPKVDGDNGLSESVAKLNWLQTGNKLRSQQNKLSL